MWNKSKDIVTMGVPIWPQSIPVFSIFSKIVYNKIEVLVEARSKNSAIQVGMCTLDATKIAKKAIVPLKKSNDKSSMLSYSSNF